MTGVLDVMGRRDLFEDLQHRHGLGLVSLLCLWTCGICVVRRRVQIIRKWQDLPKVRRYFLFMFFFPKSCWDVIREHHTTLVVWILLVLHWGWISSILAPVTFKRPRQALSYGEILSTFAPIPVIFSFINHAQRRCSRKKIKEFFPDRCRSVSKGLCFILTGKRDWTDRHPELDRDYLKWRKGIWVAILLGWLLASSLYSLWVLSYVRAGTLPNVASVANHPHKNWKPFSVTLYIWGYIVGLINMFVCVAAFDYYQEAFVPPRSGGEMETKWGQSPEPRDTVALRTLGLTIALPVACILCAAFFVPFAALPLSQESHWHHDCANFRHEVIMNGQGNSSLSSTISFYTVPSQLQLGGPPYTPQRQHVYDFDFFSVGGYKVLQYHPVDNATLSQEFEPSIKTMILDISHRRFFGCSSTFSAESLLNMTEPETICSDTSGAYEENPYLFLSMNTTSPPRSTFLRTERNEYGANYADDAPSFIVRYATADGNLTDTILLHSALTKRNHPTVLKVCSNMMASLETLGPLSIFMLPLDQYAAYLDHPRLFSF